MTLRISNREARGLLLNLQGLAAPQTGTADIQGIISKLGFVQLDSIQNVARAHHHILWSRSQSYREPVIEKMLARDRSIFEHFTHDASVLPMEFYPMWTRQFARLEAKISKWDTYRSAKLNGEHEAIKRRIMREGPLSSHAFDSKFVGKKAMWDRPPHKRALDHMWYAGELATSHRRNFVKHYDLRERVIPSHHLLERAEDSAQIDWLCRGALDRLGFATPGEVQRFWGAVSAAETKAWLDRMADQLLRVEIETATGEWFKCVAPANLEALLNSCVTPNARMRVVNPFDPIARDRERLLRVFGFDYRIEIFVPPAKRKWGYYVYPLLEGDRFVGRIELKSDRKQRVLEVKRLWAEPGIKWTEARGAKLDAELGRFGRLVDAAAIAWTCSPNPTLA